MQPLNTVLFTSFICVCVLGQVNNYISIVIFSDYFSAHLFSLELIIIFFVHSGCMYLLLNQPQPPHQFSWNYV